MIFSDLCEDIQMIEYQRLFQSKSMDLELDKDRLDIFSCMDEECMLFLELSFFFRDFLFLSCYFFLGYDFLFC